MPRKMSNHEWSLEEDYVVRECGGTPTAFSGGSGGVLPPGREDGLCQHCLMQVKGTQGPAVKVERLDLNDVVVHAQRNGLTAMFIMTFPGDDIWVCFRKEDVPKVAQFLQEHVTMCMEQQEQKGGALHTHKGPSMR